MKLIARAFAALALLLCLSQSDAQPTGSNQLSCATMPPGTVCGNSTGSTAAPKALPVGVNVTPPIPPAAALFAYNQNVYTVYPTLADISYTNAPGFRLYSGIYYNGVSPAGDFTTASNGQLQLIYPGTGTLGGILTTRNLIDGTTIPNNVGQLPFVLASKGFHFEVAATMSTNNSDCQNAIFLMPQEHNSAQNDNNPSFFVGYEQWHEFDIYECGHGTDHSGGYRGTYLQWSGKFNGAFTMAAIYASGTSSVSLASPWVGESGNWPVTFQSGEVRFLNLITGSAGPYTTGSNLTITNTTAAATIPYRSLVNSSYTNVAAFDATVEHIYGGTYDPIGQNFYISVDNVIVATLTTVNGNSPNAFRDSLHYYPIFMTQSFGALVPSTMNIRYFAMWTGSSQVAPYPVSTPAIFSGFGTGAVVTHNNSAASFSINVGTGGVATSGVINFNHTALNGWAGGCQDNTTTANVEGVVTTTTAATITNYVRTTGVAGAWPASDILQCYFTPN
jgi:hypothetical protein